MPFTIKDIANLSGIKAHTIRIWEQRYSFLKPERTNTNIRYYSNRELQIILNISLLNKYGYKISHINKMSEEVINEKILSLTNANVEPDRIVNELIKSMIEYDMDQFENIINEHISTNKVEKTVIQIIFPFLKRIGILWVTNNIISSQEHLVSNIIRQKILVGIENINVSVYSAKKVCLFLPDGEYHELGLLFVYYLLKKRGIPVIYLGASVPVHDLELIAKIKNPEYFYTHITSAGKNFNFEKFILTLSQRLNAVPAVISGSYTNNYNKIIPGKILLKKSFNEVIEFIESL